MKSTLHLGETTEITVESSARGYVTLTIYGPSETQKTALMLNQEENDMLRQMLATARVAAL